MRQLERRARQAEAASRDAAQSMHSAQAAERKARSEAERLATRSGEQEVALREGVAALVRCEEAARRDGAALASAQRRACQVRHFLLMQLSGQATTD